MLQKIRDVGLHLVDIRLRRQKIRHRFIQTGEGFEFGLVMRVGQHAHVKHKVGVHGDAAFEGEGLEHQGHGRVVRAHHVFDLAAQAGRADQAGVDHQGAFAQLGQQLTLVLNRVDQGAFGVH